MLLQQEKKEIVNLSQELDRLKLREYNLPKDIKEFNEKIEKLQEDHKKVIADYDRLMY